MRIVTREQLETSTIKNLCRIGWLVLSKFVPSDQVEATKRALCVSLIRDAAALFASHVESPKFTCEERPDGVLIHAETLIFFQKQITELGGSEFDHLKDTLLSLGEISDSTVFYTDNSAETQRFMYSSLWNDMKTQLWAKLLHRALQMGGTHVVRVKEEHDNGLVTLSTRMTMEVYVLLP